MCGIFGYIGNNTDSLDRGAILDSLRHRGPDGEGVKSIGRCLLAHTRLSIIDLSNAGLQPFGSADQRVWVTFNGEIYNYLELKQELSDYPFRSDTDTEVLLAAYEKWGEACLDRLRGMFAFGIWDENEQKLFCAVDRFSIKPLYYHQDEKGFTFGSEVRALSASGVNLRPDDKTIHDYLAHGILSHDERTFFEGIRYLCPGHKLVHKNGETSVSRYWDLQLRESPGKTYEECLDIAEEAILDSVRMHLRSDVGYGLSLSSGLDSNFLRCVVSQVGNLKRPLDCFSYCFRGTPYDECVGFDSDSSGVNYHKTNITPSMLQSRMEDAIRVMEGPLGGLGIFAFWLNMQTAREHGAKVILSGQGTDELFHGYNYFYELKIRQFHDDGQTDKVEEELALFNEHHNTDVKYGSEAFNRMVRQEDTSTPRASDGSYMNQAGFVRKGFASAFGPWTAPGQDRYRDLVKSQVYNDINYVKMPKLLVFQDKTAMDCSVEVRVPMLDHVLYETLFSIPTEYHLNNGSTKQLLRAIARRYDDPANRNSWEPIKKYMPTPQREWIKYEVDEYIRLLIKTSVLHDRGYIDKGRLMNIYEAYVASNELGNSFFIWKFMNLELMFRVFF